MHGCSNELKSLLGLLSPRTTDRLIFLGDLVNRGPDSVGTLKLILKWLKEGHSLEVVLGNHDVSLLQAAASLGFLDTNRTFLSEANLFQVQPHFVELARQVHQEAPDALAWLSHRPLFIEDQEWIAVHAGLPPTVSLTESSWETLTRVRHWNPETRSMIPPERQSAGGPWYLGVKGPKAIIYGHWATQGLQIKDFSKGMDSGCVWGGRLSALCWEDQSVYSVPAQQIYCQPLRR